MPVDILVGLQWGDEGKGKIVDILSPEYDIVARFQGGPNAGHTLVIGDNKFIFHTMPSGVIHEKTYNVLGPGMVINPVTFKEEAQVLENHQIDFKDRILISRNAHLILPSQIHLDKYYEWKKDENKVGSTLRGIGPAYQDKYGRTGLRMVDLLKPGFKEKYDLLKSWHFEITRNFDFDRGAFDQAEKEWFEALNFIRQFSIVDTEVYLNDELNADKNILAEGAQGTLLDINFGTYPYVTSSNTISSGCCVGLGIAPQQIRKVFGVFKAYTTRVGEGPFFTELHDETGKLLRDNGCEYGATTGRPRRCGWLDLVGLKQSIMLNGVTDLVITKADVLSGMPVIKACTEYLDEKGTKVNYSDHELTKISPHYESLDSWEEDISEVKEYSGLPVKFKDYLSYIEQYTGVRISVISLGPKRRQTIRLS